MSPSLSSQVRSRHAEMMILELEAVALRLFEERGFGNVTVEEAATAAQVSERTFYRYFPAKQDVLQVRVDRRSAALRSALAARPRDEPFLQSLRIAFTEVMAAEDPELTRRWISVIVHGPDLVRGVLGGVQLKIQRVIVEYLADRLGTTDDALVPTVVAAAVGGVAQSAISQWFIDGGDLTARIAASLEVLEQIARLSDEHEEAARPPK